MKIANRLSTEIERLTVLKELQILDSIEEKAYDDLTKLAAYICDTPISLVSLVDADRQWFKSHYGLDARETPRDYAFCDHAIEQGYFFEVEDSTKDERFHDNPLVTGEPRVIFYAGYPLGINGHNLGTLCVIDHKPKKLSGKQVELISALGRQVQDQLELRLSNINLTESNEILNTLSMIDPLTNLPNRRVLFETLENELKRCSREMMPIAIILIDVDHFKAYNDNYGHSEGDICLKKIAEGLKKPLHRASDLVARYGGEEFIYILPNTDTDGAVKVASALENTLKDMNIRHEHSRSSDRITVSMGICAVDAHDMNSHKLIQYADEALYRAKESGRNQYRVFKKRQ